MPALDSLRVLVIFGVFITHFLSRGYAIQDVGIPFFGYIKQYDEAAPYSYAILSGGRSAAPLPAR